MIRNTIGLLLIGIAVWFLSQQQEVFVSLQQIAYFDFILLLLLSLLIILTLGIQFNYLIRIFGLHLSFREWFGLTVVNTMFNYYLPAHGGLVMRGAYLKRKYNFPWSQYTSLMVVSQLVMLGIVALLGLVFLIASNEIGSEHYWQLFGLFGSVLSITIIAYQIIPILAKLSARFDKFKPFLQQFIDGFECWRQHRLTSLRFSVLVIVLVFLWGLRLYVCFMALGSPIHFHQIMIIQTFVGLSFVISITPGNLGIKEGITVFGASLFGISPTTALLASLIDRAVTMLVVFAVGLVFTHILIRKIQS